MNNDDNVLQPTAEPIPNLADALTSTREAVRQLVWAYKVGMAEFGYVAVTGYCPADHVEDFSVDTNLDRHNPRSAQFLASMRRAAEMLIGCDDEIPRA